MVQLFRREKENSQRFQKINEGYFLANMKQNSLAAWRKALEECNLDSDFYIHRELPLDKPLPWSVVDSGVKSDYLKKEVVKARQRLESPPCPLEECHECGVC